MLSLKTIFTSFIFRLRNNTVHSFLDSEIVYKCEGDFYSASQILANKDNNINYIWGLMVLLALKLTLIFNIYIFPTETILRMLHHINFRLEDFSLWIKKKSQEETIFKSLFKVMNKFTSINQKRRRNNNKLLSNDKLVS
jgi:hypothetical protein